MLRLFRLLRIGLSLCMSLRLRVRTFHRWGGLVFIVDDHDNFPNWIIILNSMFPNWMMTLSLLPLDGIFLSVSDLVMDLEIVVYLG